VDISPDNLRPTVVEAREAATKEEIVAVVVINQDHTHLVVAVAGSKVEILATKVAMEDSKEVKVSVETSSSRGTTVVVLISRLLGASSLIRVSIRVSTKIPQNLSKV
jgi:hypothetical protein